MADDQEFAPQASPGPEIVPSETLAEESEIEPAENATSEAALAEAGCPILLGLDVMGLPRGPRCARELHIAPAGVDKPPVCLMHSKDEGKQSGQRFDEFWRNFEGILKEAGEGEAHLEWFVFPEANFIVKEFKAICRFRGVTFTQKADFGGARFWQKADFRGATFTQSANFGGATFTQSADFNGVTFNQGAEFTFASFQQDSTFAGAAFRQNAKFTGATFAQEVRFWRATFTQSAEFFGATFVENALFGRAEFARDTSFIRATFTQNVFFTGAIFTNNALFEWAEFNGTGDWRSCRFLDQAVFRHTKFQPKEPGTPSGVFSLAEFSKPEDFVFDDVDLNRVIFLNCDVNEFQFTSSVRWAKGKGNRGLKVFEEDILLDPKLAKLQEEYGLIDYGAVEQIYHQLKKNYDSRLDYWTADQFHFGEMEMKRLAGPASGPLLSVRRWLHRNLSILNGYRIFSSYGNSYTRPAWLLLLFVLLAALAFPCAGLVSSADKCKPNPEAPGCTLRYSWDKKNLTDNLVAEGELLRDSAVAAVDTATFQRNPEYIPAYPWGRVLAILETLLTSTLFALFLLAIRRQFRR